MTRTRRFAVVLALLFTLALGACNGGEGSTVEIVITSPPTATPAPTPTRVPEGPIEGVFLNLLSRIPMPDTDQFVITLNDFTKLQEVRGLNPADYNESEDAYFEYYMSLRGPSDLRLEPLKPMPAMTGLGSVSGPSIGADGRKYFGFDFRDVQSTAVLDLPSGLHLGKIQITQGIISPSLAEDLLSACEECIPPEILTYDGTEYMSWPRLLRIDNDGPPLFEAQRFLTRLMIHEGVVLHAISDEGIEALIDLSTGSRESMASDENLVALITAVDEFEASSVVISAPGFTLEALLDRYRPREKIEVEEFTLLAPLLVPYLAAATGVGLDENGPFNVIALVHETEELARENADRLRIRARVVIRTAVTRSGDPFHWSEWITSMETFIEGRMLIAKIQPSEPYSPPIIQRPSLHTSGKINLLIHE